MARCQALATLIEYLAGERTGGRSRYSRSPPNRAASQHALCLVPQFSINDRFMQAGMTGTLVPNLAEVNRIRKQLIERTAGECVAARLPAVLWDPCFGA